MSTRQSRRLRCSARIAVALIGVMASGGCQLEVTEQGSASASSTSSSWPGGDDPALVPGSAGSSPPAGAADAISRSALSGTDLDLAGILALDPAGSGLSGADLEWFLAARYEAYWEVFDRLRRYPAVLASDDESLLVELAAGSRLEASYHALTELADAGLLLREPEVPAVAGTDADTEHRVRVAWIDGPVAELVVCMVNDDVTVSSSDGRVVKAGVTTVLSRATMVLADDGWKLERSRAVAISDGVSGCWFSSDDEYPH